MKIAETCSPLLLAVDDLEWAYLSGLFDGEGCFKVSRDVRAGREHWALLIDICNTYRGVLDWVHDKFGGYLYSTEKKAPWRRKFNWSTGATLNMRFMIQKMLPHLKIKHDQAVVALKLLETKGTYRESRGQAKTDVNLQLQAQCAKELRLLRWKEWPAVPRHNAQMITCRCGKQFTPKTVRHKHCSTKCVSLFSARDLRAEKRVDPGTDVCICGREFSKSQNRARWCSPKCRTREFNRKHIQYYEKRGISWEDAQNDQTGKYAYLRESVHWKLLGKDRAAICKFYTDGNTIADTCKKFGLAERTLTAMLNRSGIRRPDGWVASRTRSENGAFMKLSKIS